jgi:DNA-binding beta-propeller fold protein YncE
MNKGSGIRFEAVPGWHQRPRHLTYGFVSDVAVGPNDEVFILTRRPGQIIVYSSDGSFIRAWGEGLFGDQPHGITVGGGRVYCTDVSNHVIHVFSLEGEQVDLLGIPGVASDTGIDTSISEVFTRTASIKRGAPPFNMPTKVAIAPSGDLYVSDGYGNTRIHQFSPDGRLVRSWGEPGPRPGQFWVVHNVAISADGRVFVCDRENERVQVFDSTGNFLEEWVDLQRPAAIAIGADGHFYVSELSWKVEAGSFRQGRLRQAFDARITELDEQGRVLQHATKVGADNVASFLSPHGIAIDSRGNLYVADVMVTPEMEPKVQMVQKLTRAAV